MSLANGDVVRPDDYNAGSSGVQQSSWSAPAAENATGEPFFGEQIRRSMELVEDDAYIDPVLTPPPPSSPFADQTHDSIAATVAATLSDDLASSGVNVRLPPKVLVKVFFHHFIAFFSLYFKFYLNTLNCTSTSIYWYFVKTYW